MTNELKSALLDLYLDAEEIAVSSYATWNANKWEFSDLYWREQDPRGFRLARRSLE